MSPTNPFISPKSVATTDYHTAGEPFRIVAEGLPSIPGRTVCDRREWAISSPELQDLRLLLCNEPRGHADMYGGFIVPPDDQDADLGVLFWHREGFSTACGHGTIALGVWAIESGLVELSPGGETEVRIDVPSGRVVARVRATDGFPHSVVFRNVPSHVVARSVSVRLSGREIRVDVAFSGAIYASVAAGDLDLRVVPKDLRRMVTAAGEIKRELSRSKVAEHPGDDRLSGIYGVIFHESVEDADGRVAQRNVTVFADGEVDRSPCGSGTSARVALLRDEGTLELGQTLVHESIVGTRFLASATEVAEDEGIPAVMTEVEGMAYKTGEHSFVIDERDPVGTGFLLA